MITLLPHGPGYEGDVHNGFFWRLAAILVE